MDRICNDKVLPYNPGNLYTSYIISERISTTQNYDIPFEGKRTSPTMIFISDSERPFEELHNAVPMRDE
jgi:hypothetical protein